MCQAAKNWTKIRINAFPLLEMIYICLRMTTNSFQALLYMGLRGPQANEVMCVEYAIYKARDHLLCKLQPIIPCHLLWRHPLSKFRCQGWNRCDAELSEQNLFHFKNCESENISSPFKFVFRPVWSSLKQAEFKKNVCIQCLFASLICPWKPLVST